MDGWMQSAHGMCCNVCIIFQCVPTLTLTLTLTVLEALELAYRESLLQSCDVCSSEILHLLIRHSGMAGLAPDLLRVLVAPQLSAIRPSFSMRGRVTLWVAHYLDPSARLPQGLSSSHCTFSYQNMRVRGGKDIAFSNRGWGCLHTRTQINYHPEGPESNLLINVARTSSPISNSKGIPHHCYSDLRIAYSGTLSNRYCTFDGCIVKPHI